MIVAPKFIDSLQIIKNESLHTPLMQHRTAMIKKYKKVPLKFLGMIISHLIKKSTINIKKSFIIWHSRRSQRNYNLSIDLILTNNHTCQQTFFYRLKNLCRNEFQTTQKKLIDETKIKIKQNQEIKSINKDYSKISLNLKNQQDNDMQIINNNVYNIKQANKNGDQDYQSIVPITNQYLQESLQTISQEKAITVIEYSMSSTEKKIDFIEERIDGIREGYNKLSTRLLSRLLRNYEKRLFNIYCKIFLNKMTQFLPK